MVQGGTTVRSTIVYYYQVLSTFTTIVLKVWYRYVRYGVAFHFLLHRRRNGIPILKTKMHFHAQIGNPSRTSDALNVASSMFYEGMEKFTAGELIGALDLFEGCLSINQKYLNPSSSGTVLCYKNIAAVHDRLGNVNQAADYYERARSQLSSKQLPQSERGPTSRRKRAELLRHVEKKLEVLPRSPEPKVRQRVRTWCTPELILCPLLASY